MDPEPTAEPEIELDIYNSITISKSAKFASCVYLYFLQLIFLVLNYNFLWSF